MLYRTFPTRTDMHFEGRATGAVAQINACALTGELGVSAHLFKHTRARGTP